MAQIVVMPQLGNTVETCLIVAWNVAVGDTVSADTVLCEVETDKSTMEVPAGAEGTVLKLLWEEGDEVPVKDPLVVVGAAGEDADAVLADAGFAAEAAPVAEAAPEAAPAAPAETAAPAAAAAPAAPVGEFTGAASPRAKAAAQTAGMPLDAVGAGSGPHGRVIERDVTAALAAGPGFTAARRGDESLAAGYAGATGTGIGGRLTSVDTAAAPTAAAAAPTAAIAAEFPGNFTDTPLKGIRKLVADRMRYALESSAQLTYTTTANAAGLLNLRKRLKGAPEALGLNAVTIGDLVGFAVIKTLLQHSTHNAHLDNGVLREFENVHLGFACDTPRGLLVPTVRNADSMNLKQFSAASKALAADAIAGQINPDLLSGATFTVSNLGSFGIESFTPIINVPQTAILGVDAIFPRAKVNADGSVGVEQRIGFSLTADHQVIDGADAARFLRDLVVFIENIDITALG